MTRAPAPAKLNLALVVGPRRADGKHEVTTVLQRVALGDRVGVERAPALRVDGFPEDTIVARALTALADAAGVEPSWRARIWKRLPIAAGLGGGSSDAGTALRLANDLLPRPLDRSALARVAARVGADVAFFLEHGPQLGEGDGTSLTPLDLPQDFWVVLLLPHRARKLSTAAVYEAFDRRGGGEGYADRRRALVDALRRVRRPRDLGALPRNDLARSPLADELRARGAFRADVTGAGPAVYGLFHHRAAAVAARRAVAARGESWITVPAWYG